MRASLNKVTLIGNVGQPIEIKNYNNKKQGYFPMVTSEAWKDKASGERRITTVWHHIKIVNDLLLSVCQRLVNKGSHVFIEGFLRSHEDDRTTQKNSRYEIVATKVMVLNRPEQEEEIEENYNSINRKY